MPELVVGLWRATAIPLALFSLVSSGLVTWSAGLVPGLVALATGVVSVVLVALVAARHARKISCDLADLTRQLQTSDLVDVRSLRPRTVAGRGIATALGTLISRVRDAALSEDAVRNEIETAQALRVNFVASMGHDLRAPLNNMLGFADLLIMDESDPHASSQRASVEMIRQRTLDLLTLIDEILDWARLEAGRLKLDPKQVEVGELVAGALELAEHRSAGRPLDIRLASIHAGLMVQVDRARVEQAIVAVMGDAIRNGQGDPVYVSAEVGSNRVVVVVRDPNLLVREEDQARFFEAFRPSYAPSGKRIAGLGLGVACARALLQAHGGDVSFVSRAGAGTVFKLALPRAS